MKKPIKLNQLTGWWVVCYNSGVVAHWSVCGTRKGAISNFLENSSYTWDDAPNNGWYAMKVNISFDIFSQS